MSAPGFWSSTPAQLVALTSPSEDVPAKFGTGGDLLAMAALG